MERDIWEQLYRQHYGAALLYALSRCRGDRALAEDMVQEAFFRAFTAAPEDLVSFRAWLIRVLRNLIIDYNRRTGRLSDAPPPEQTDDCTPETELLRREDIRLLYEAMETVSDDDRELLRLHYFARLSIKEIAAALGIDPGTARVRLHRARLRLRKRMEENGYEL